MKRIIPIAIVLITLSCISCNNTNEDSSIYEYYSTGSKERKQYFSRDTTKFDEGAAYYQCPDHPEVVSGREGECPKCGSALEMHEKQ